MSINQLDNTKPPKGTIDLYSSDYDKISYYKIQLENIFIQEGGVGLETPVFEQREILLNKYGEEAETKLVFNLEDNGSDDAEKYTLRYDLTIPKIRFIKSKSIDKARIYSIGKVYRRDNPSAGRFREFYQADFDIIGEDSSSLINELILLKMASNFIKKNNLGSFRILINDTENLRCMLEKIFKYSKKSDIELDNKKFKSICSTIDKLDKYSFDKLKTEFMSKGLTQEQIELLEKMLSDDKYSNQESEKKITKLIEMSKQFGFNSNIKFTPYLARGLDYYKGIIFEIVLDNFNSTIISGGRYDGLIDFDSMSLIGISFGLSRILNLLPEPSQNKWKPIYMLTTISKSISLENKLNICSKLETKFNTNIMIASELDEKKLIKTITSCVQKYIKYLFVIAPDELKKKQVILKDLENSTQELVELE